VSSARERYQSLVGSSRKRKLFGGFQLLIVAVIIAAWALVHWAPDLKIGKLMSSAFSKGNKGIVVNYLHWTSENVIQFLGDPETELELRENEILRYWKFDPVTLEIHFYNDDASRIAFATKSQEILDHLEDQILEVFGRMEDWKLAMRTVDGESKVVFINHPGRMTVVKYEDAVMVYSYLFPES
jgi:hypothetical protein